MARVFIKLDKIDNSRKCIIKFFKDRDTKFDDLIENNIPVINLLTHAICDFAKLDLLPGDEIKNQLSKIKSDFLLELDEFINILQSENLPKTEEAYIKIRNWIEP